jgi:FkbM family methyltransferase
MLRMAVALKRLGRWLVHRSRFASSAYRTLLGGGQAQRALRKLKREVRGRPRRVGGTVRFLDWEIEYVDAAALVSGAEVLVVKGWNDFSADTPSPRILDCGANIGLSVLNYKRKYPAARITAFEPDPSIAPVLRRNLLRNRIADVEVIEAAVWKEDGRAGFWCEGAEGSKLASLTSDGRRTVDIETVRLDPFIDRAIDLLKVDIEGAEYVVLESIVSKLDLVKNLIVECHVKADQVEKLGRMLMLIAAAGFRVSISSYGAWRDLTHRSGPSTSRYDQYMLLSAWRSP